MRSPLAKTGEARSGGRLLVDCLIAHNVPLMTCVPGESFLAVLDALYEIEASGARIPRLITTRHEAAAANMAEAAGKLTGVPAVCFVTRGPGATHASIAVHTAYQDGTPMILIVGQVSRAVRGREAFQEMEYSTVFGSSAKAVVEIQSADRIAEHIARAVHTARTGRPGPVVIVVPEDMLTDKTLAPVILSPPVTVPVASSKQIQSVVARLDRAERPLLIVGGTGWTQEAGEQIALFAERLRVPIAAAFRWQDAVDNRSPAYVGYLGLGDNPRLRRRLSDADLIVAVGPRLDDPTTQGFEAPFIEGHSAEIVMINEDIADLCNSIVPDIAVHGEIVDFVQKLARSEMDANPSREAWLEELRQLYVEFTKPVEAAGSIDLAHVVRHVREVLPDDAVVTNGAGNYSVWVQRFFEFRRFHTQLAPRNGAMGYGLPAALTASALDPGRKAVAFVGDGSLLMSGNEFATAVQEQLDVVVILFNNGMYGTIRMHQEKQYPGRVIATTLQNPDFVAYAESFGALGRLVLRTEDFPEAFATALERRGPSLIELRTDPEQLTPDLRL